MMMTMSKNQVEQKHRTIKITKPVVLRQNIFLNSFHIPHNGLCKEGLDKKILRYPYLYTGLLLCVEERKIFLKLSRRTGKLHNESHDHFKLSAVDERLYWTGRYTGCCSVNNK